MYKYSENTIRLKLTVMFQKEEEEEEGTDNSDLINRQPRLSHLSILQKIKRHPKKMPLNLIQILTHNANRQKRIVQMALLNRFSRRELVVIIKGLDIIVWVGTE